MMKRLGISEIGKYFKWIQKPIQYGKHKKLAIESFFAINAYLINTYFTIYITFSSLNY